MSPDDPQHGGQSQAPAGKLGREKRVEYLAPSLLRHAAPRVRDLQEDVFSLRQFRRQATLGEKSLVSMLPARGHADDSRLVAERLRGVQDQVHDHLVNLRGVGDNQRHALGQVQLQGCFTRDRQPEQTGGLLNELVEVEMGEHEASPAGVGQHLPAQVGRAFGGLLDLAQGWPQRGIDWRLGSGQAGVAQDHRQQVVEIVGDATRHHAQAFQFLRFLKLTFQDEFFLFPSLARRCPGSGR